MKIRLLTVVSRLPAWVKEAEQEYRKRLPAQFRLEIVEVPIAKRSKTTTPTQCQEQEAQRLMQQISESSRIIVFDVGGTPLSSERLAEKFEEYESQGQEITLIIGGPDGLAPSILKKSHERWSLSAMTFPHNLVRVICMEQIYRAYTILSNHPYHK